MTVVKHSISDDIALIEISNPPVNAISAAVRIELLQTIETLALEKTIKTKEAHYFSRSHQAIWHKGATSGYIQKVVEILIDDDQDALYMSVEIGENGASCHVGYKSCFYRKIKLEDNQNKAVLEDLGHKKVFDPEKVYGDAPNPTKL